MDNILSLSSRNVQRGSVLKEADEVHFSQNFRFFPFIVIIFPGRRQIVGVRGGCPSHSGTNTRIEDLTDYGLPTPVSQIISRSIK